MSPPQANTFSYDSGLDAEYPATFRFPVSWWSIGASFESVDSPAPVVEAPTEIVQTKVREAGDAQWEMVIPKMARPPSKPAPERLRAKIRLPEAVPVFSTGPQSSLMWKLILLAAVAIGLILWAWARTERPGPVSLAPADGGAIRC